MSLKAAYGRDPRCSKTRIGRYVRVRRAGFLASPTGGGISRFWTPSLGASAKVRHDGVLKRYGEEGRRQKGYVSCRAVPQSFLCSVKRRRPYFWSVLWHLVSNGFLPRHLRAVPAPPCSAPCGWLCFIFAWQGEKEEGGGWKVRWESVELTQVFRALVPSIPINCSRGEKMVVSWFLEINQPLTWLRRRLVRLQGGGKGERGKVHDKVVPLTPAWASVVCLCLC